MIPSQRINPVFVLYLAILIAFAPFSTTMYLAAMPILKLDFQVSDLAVQLTLAVFFIGYPLGQLFWGPVSDRIGRKPAILIGSLFYVLASMLCAYAWNIEALVIGRFLQALGAAAGVVNALAIVRDRFVQREQMLRVLTLMTAIMTIAPLVSPMIGSELLVYFHWQANFWFLSGYGMVVWLLTWLTRESYPRDKRQPLPISHLIGAYIEQACYRPFTWVALAVAANFCVMFAFVAASSFIYIHLYHVTDQHFGYVFSINVVGFILGSASLHLFKRYIALRKLLVVGMILALVGPALMLVLTHLFDALWIVTISVFIATYGVGLVAPNLMSLALKHVVAYNGITAALVGTFRFTFAMVVSLAMGVLLVYGVLALALVMLFMGVLSLCCMLRYFGVDH